MKLRLHETARLLLPVALLAIFATSAGHSLAVRPELKREEGARPLPESLSQAILFSALIRRNDSEQAKYRMKIVEQLVEEGFLREALDLAKQIPGYRRGEALGKVARGAAREGEEALFAEAVQASEALLAFTEPWQEEHAKAHLAVAYAAKRDWKRAETLREACAGQRQRVIADSGIAVERAKAGKKFDLAPTEKERSMSEETIQPELLKKAAALNEIGMLILEGSKARGVEVESAEDAFRLAEETARLTHVEMTLALFGVAKGLLAAGLEEEGEDKLGEAAAHLNFLGYAAEWKPSYFLEFFDFFLESGRDGLAREVLTEAVDFPPNIHPMWRPSAYSTAALIAHRQGEEDQAKELWLKAVGEAKVNPNDRVQAIGCVEICLSYARAGRPIHEEVAAELEEVREIILKWRT